jgi:hypothetical protein
MNTPSPNPSPESGTPAPRQRFEFTPTPLGENVFDRGHDDQTKFVFSCVARRGRPTAFVVERHVHRPGQADKAWTFTFVGSSLAALRAALGRFDELELERQLSKRTNRISPAAPDMPTWYREARPRTP